MAITLVGTAEAGVGNGAAVTLTLPGGMQEGDLVVAVVSGSTGFTSSGYTLFHPSNAPLGGYKFMGSTPDTTVVFAGTGSAFAGAAGVALVFRGVDLVTPLDATPTFATAGSGSPDSPSITTVTNGAAVISAFQAVVLDTSVTAPSGYGDQVDAAGDGSFIDATAGIAWLNKATAGAENPAAWTNVTSAAWSAVSAALRPAGEAPAGAEAEGDLAAGVAAAEGQASAIVSADGALASGDASVEAAIALVSAEGALEAGVAAVEGQAAAIVSAGGALVPGAAEVEGSAAALVAVAGALQSGAGDIAADVSDPGWVLCGTFANVNDGGAIEWAAEENHALCFMTAGQSSQILRGSNFGLGIPSFADILGIEFRLLISRGGAGNADYAVNIGKDGSALATPKTGAISLTTSFELHEFGAPDDLWGLTWTPAELNAGDFLAQYKVTNAGTGAVIAPSQFAASLRVRVTYESLSAMADGDLVAGAAAIAAEAAVVAGAEGAVGAGAAAIDAEAAALAVSEGALQSGAGAIAAEAALLAVAEGALQSGAGALDAEASVVVGAEGALQAGAAAIAAELTNVAEGELQSGAAEIVGDAAAGVDASGALQANGATIEGEAAAIDSADGDLAASLAEIEGEASAIAGAHGSLQSAGAALDGEATALAAAVASLLAGGAEIHGDALVSLAAQGGLQAGEATISITATTDALITVDVRYRGLDTVDVRYRGLDTVDVRYRAA